MTQKSILITGCSSGIGYDAAHRLHAKGWKVFATCRKAEDVARLQEEGLISCVLDHADTASMTAALDFCLEQTGRTLDAVFNNGAFACPGAVEDLPTDALRSVFETNFFGYHELTRQVIPVMRAQGHGRIINCSSVLGLVVMPWRGAYNASKFALEGLTHTLRIGMRDTPIDVILIEPGPITTRIRENSIPHFERWIDWESSPRRAQYEAQLRRRLYHKRGKDPHELPPSAVTDKLLQALSAKTPKPCYFVTTPTYFMSALRRVLPMRLLDRVIAKA